MLCLTLDENSCQEELVPLSRRRYEKLTVDLTDWESPLEALRAVLPPDTDNDVYRITFTGERGESPLDLTTLETVLAPRFYGLTLRDRTRVRPGRCGRGGRRTPLPDCFSAPWPPAVRRTWRMRPYSWPCALAWPPWNEGRMWLHEDQNHDRYLRQAPGRAPHSGAGT